jgi:hypothetical protein
MNLPGYNTAAHDDKGRAATAHEGPGGHTPRAGRFTVCLRRASDVPLASRVYT